MKLKSSDQNTGYLYRHIRLDTNEVFYIGISLDNRKDKFIRAYNTWKRSKFWKNIANKTNYEVDIMMINVPEDILIEREKEFIKLYGRSDLGEGTLVNLTDGGEGTTRTKYPNRKMKEEQRLSMMGRKLSQETKDKISKAHSGKSHDPKLYESRRLAAIGRKYPTLWKKVIQKTLDGETVKIWNSVKSCKDEGFTPKQVSNCCRGETKSHKGFKWEYINS